MLQLWWICGIPDELGTMRRAQIHRAEAIFLFSKRACENVVDEDNRIIIQALAITNYHPMSQVQDMLLRCSSELKGTNFA